MPMLKCPACGKQDAALVKKKDLEKWVEGPASGPGLGSVGIIPPDVAIKVLSVLVQNLLPWFLSQRTRYVVCRACGHYELFEK